MKLLRFLLVFLAVGALMLTLQSSRERRAGRAARAQLARALGNVVERVRAEDENRRSADALFDAGALAKARSLALLIKADPAVLADPSRLGRACRTLNTDALIVTDETKAPAFTNCVFGSVCTEVGTNGLQYVSVARLDRAGVVRIGVKESRRQSFHRLLAPGDIARTARVRRGGSVKIEGRSKSEEGRSEECEKGQLTLSQDCGEQRVTVSVPAPSGLLGGRWTYGFLVFVTTLLVLAVLRVFLPNLRKVTLAQVRAVLLFVGAMVSVVLAFESVRERAVGAVVREQMLLALENATTRVRSSLEKVKTTVALTQRANLVKARAYALFVEADPTLLDDPSRLETARCAFDADEVIATDEKGVIVAAMPDSQRGYDLASGPVASEFLPAITNRAFELVKGPFARGLDGKIFQYACVARPDRPGVLGVGFNAARLAHVQSLAGLDRIVKTSTGRSDCFVEIEKVLRGTPRPRGYFTADRQGVRCLCLAERSDDVVVTVGLPAPADLLAAPAVSSALVLLAVLLFIGVFGALAPEAVAASWEQVRNFMSFFWGLHAERTGKGVPARRKSLRRLLLNPITFVCLVAYLICLSCIWTLRTKESWELARKGLLLQSANAFNEVSVSVDNMLFAIARAMVRHYRTPDSFTSRDAADLAHRYDIDEVSVVDAKGVALVTNFGDEHFVMASSPEAAKFNCLLQGVQSYSQPFRATAEDPNVVRKYAGVSFPDAPGYVQVGIDRSRLTSDLRYLFADSVRDRKLGKSGFLLWAVNRTGEVVANGAAESRPDDTLAGLGFNSVTAPEEGVPFVAEFYGRPCLVVGRRYANLRLYAVRPCDEIFGLDKLVWPGVMSALFFIGFALLAMRLTDLVSRLKAFILVEHERQRTDMTMARTIQTSALPVGFPNEGDFKIFARMTAARDVGGDFYDFSTLADGRILFLVADVSGKGVPAALFMMRAKATLRSLIAECDGNLSEAVRLANDNLSEHNDAGMFVTAWVGIFDRKTGGVEYVSAGHNPPLVKRADGSVEWLRERGGLALAVLSGAKYRASACRLGKGDSIFLYTDGVTEAIDTKEEQYGEARLEAVLKRSGSNFVTEISADLAAFTAGAEQFDDITMLALDVPAADAGDSHETGWHHPRRSREPLTI